MPNLYGQQEDDEDKVPGGQEEDNPFAPQQAQGQAAPQVEKGPSAPGYTNLNDIFALNKGVADRTSKALTDKVYSNIGGSMGTQVAQRNVGRPTDSDALGVRDQKGSATLKEIQYGVKAQQTPLLTKQAQVGKPTALSGAAQQPSNLLTSAAQAKAPKGNAFAATEQRKTEATGIMPSQTESVFSSLNFGPTLAKPSDISQVGVADSSVGSSSQALTSGTTRDSDVNAEIAANGPSGAGPVQVGVATPEQGAIIQQSGKPKSPEELALERQKASAQSALGVIGESEQNSLAQQAALQKQLADATKANELQTAEETDLLKGYQGMDTDLESYASDDGQALLEDIYGPGVTAWDAALANLGGARDTFSNLDAKFRDYDEKYAEQAGQNQKMRASDIKALQGQLGQVGDDLGSLTDQRGEQQSALDKLNSTQINTPGSKTVADLISDPTKRMDHTTAGQRGATNNATKAATLQPILSRFSDEPDVNVGGWGQDAWVVAEQMFKGSGMTDQEASAYWDQFRKSLPPEVENYVNGMVSKGGVGLEANTPEDWAWFQQLLTQYMKEHPPKKGKK